MADTRPKPKVTRDAEPVPFDGRTRRVMDLRRQIHEGTYQPDPRAIAEAILREWTMDGDLLDEATLQSQPSAGDLSPAAERFVVRPGTPDEDAPRAARTA